MTVDVAVDGQRRNQFVVVSLYQQNAISINICGKLRQVTATRVPWNAQLSVSDLHNGGSYAQRA